MKKFFLTAALAVAVAAASFAADPVKVSARIQTAFHKEFSAAINPSWEALPNGIFHVNFFQQGQIMDAYFNEDAVLISFARYVSEEQLPLLVNKTIETKFSNAQLKHVQEMVVGDETSYLITAEKGNSTIVARVFTSGSVEVIRKIKH